MAALVVAGTLAAVAATWALEAVRWTAFSAQAAAQSARVSGGGEAERITRLHFRYRGCTRFVTVAVGRDELAAARVLDTGTVFRAPWPLRAAYLRTLVGSQVESAAVRSVIEQLRMLRHRLELDDDAYAEMIARFVQEIPYGAIDGRVRLPAEVFARRVAACDDRSLLLATLLVHEGYDAALFAFDPQAHVAVGLRSASGEGFRGSGYAFIETNRPAFIGEASGTFIAWAAWRRNPQVVPLGGRLVYSAGDETSFIVRMRTRASFLTRQLEQYAEYAHSGPEKWRDSYAEQVRRKSEAQRTVALIEAHDFDRERLFRALVERAPEL